MDAMWKQDAACHVTEHILPFWRRFVARKDTEDFYGAVGEDGAPRENSTKGGIYIARILWTFSGAYRLFRNPEDLAMARRALKVLREQLMDPVHGGVFWEVSAEGQPVNTRKQLYNLAFAIYGLAEYGRATGDTEAGDEALTMFRLMEARGTDPVHGGYPEAFARDWTPLDDMRLSGRDLNTPKSMNTHLHILEAFTALLRVRTDEGLHRAHTALCQLMIRRIVGPDGHVRKFFTMDWTPVGDAISYGHDIEASWLLWEAACVNGTPGLRDQARPVVLKLAEGTLRDGMSPDGGLRGDCEGGVHHDLREWWPQAEAPVGFLNAWQMTGNPEWLKAARQVWDFALTRVADTEGGEWFRHVRQDGTPVRGEDKAEFWKCPYHNSRACFEIYERLTHREAIS